MGMQLGTTLKRNKWCPGDLIGVLIHKLSLEKLNNDVEISILKCSLSKDFVGYYIVEIFIQISKV